MEYIADPIRVIPESIRGIIEHYSGIYGRLQEIRLRVNEWIILTCNGREYVLEERQGGKRITIQDINDCFKRISEYSVYAYEEELKQGYITIQGGHRVGFAGKVLTHDGQVRNIRNITYINIRVASQVKGCADNVLPYLYVDNEIVNTLIISPPGGGKTTLLRDIIRQVSDGHNNIQGLTVAVVDERSEICACYKGIPQNDIGMRTDVLDSCPKAEGIIRLVRSMAPRVVAVDEIGTSKDIEAIEYALVSGCSLIATVHGKDMQDISGSSLMGKVVAMNLFKRYVFLGGMKVSGVINCIMDDRGKILYGGN